MALPNFVKFQRGSITAYNALLVKDQDTLYFINDANDATKGSLYLGERLISSVGTGSGVSTLAELSDVLITGAQTGDFLVKSSSGTWAAVGATAVAALIVEAGGLTASVDINEDQFQFVNGALELKGYSSASDNFIPVKSTTGLSWQAAPIDVSGRVANLESAMTAVYTELSAVDGKITTAINSAIANANHLTYSVVGNLESATATNTIYLHASSVSAENNIYEEFMLVNGQLEKLGNLSVDLSGYATTADMALKADATAVSVLSGRVGNLESLTNNFVYTTTFTSVVGDLSVLSTYQETPMSVADSLADIYSKLIWYEIS